MATVAAETRGAVGLARLDRPDARNALSPELMEELAAVCERWDEDAEVRCIVIAGGDKWFAAGADIKAMAKRTLPEVITSPAARFWPRLAAVRTPTIAAVSGYALGGGCELALACDMIVASEEAEFGQPEILLGIIPGGGGTQRLARLLGPSKAKDLILTGRQVAADEALRIGLVDQVVPADELHERALALAAELARGAVVAQGLAKNAIDQGFQGTLAGGLELEQRLFAEVFGTEDARIGVASFLEHGPGKAQFVGR
jgi:enoyl-CoA hydratase/carnithine racemase